MLQLFYTILAFYLQPGLILAFGLSFLFLAVPRSKGLEGYRMARHMMAGSYLTFFAALMFEAFTFSFSTPPVLQQLLILTVGCLQATLFTFALTTLVDVHFFSWHRVGHELLVILLPALTALLVFFFAAPRLAVWAFALLALLYGCKLVGYVVLFRSRYHDYEQRMAAYFSDDERTRLLWVRRSFFAALAIGILALPSALFPSLATSLVFTLAILVYYTLFALRFLNYPSIFTRIAEALQTPPISQPSHEGEEQLMEQLADLMTRQRLYTRPDLTIDDVAILVGRPHRTVSATINACKGTNFKGWVNAYRVEEAVRLIQQGYLHHHTTDALATEVGFANRISFYRVFKHTTGQSPTDHR